MYHKLFAAIAAGLAAYAVLTVLTLGSYFVLNDYGATWQSSISSGFNYVTDVLAGTRPFVTWHSFTVLTYLLAVIGVAAMVTLCFTLMAFCIGVWLKNSYSGFFIFLIFNGAVVALSTALPMTWLIKHALVLAPIWLWLKESLWFTDGGLDILWQNFEILGVSASLLLLTGLCVFSAFMFKRRDIA
jgi:hypothetical protein